MSRTLQQQLVDKGLATNNQSKTRNQRRKERIENFRETGFYTEQETKEEQRIRKTEELMGIRKPKFKRYRGAYRSR